MRPFHFALSDFAAIFYGQPSRSFRSKWGDRAVFVDSNDFAADKD
jgi:hypothetical protein